MEDLKLDSRLGMRFFTSPKPPISQRSPLLKGSQACPIVLSVKNNMPMKMEHWWNDSDGGRLNR
jgi:hypothetical protein